MALNTFGWTPAEVTTDSAGNVVAGVTLTVFTDVAKTTQVTGLFDKDGTTPLASGVVVSDNKGRFGFKAADTYSLLYVYDGSTSDPWPIAAHEALDSGSATHAQAVADAQAAANSAAASAALVGAPADTAIAAAVNGAATQTSAALKAAYVGKGALLVNIRDYGVVMDGTTDNKVSLQTAADAARDAGRTLFIPAGDLYWTGNVNVYTNVRCEGRLVYRQAADNRLTIARTATPTVVTASGLGGLTQWSRKLTGTPAVRGTLVLASTEEAIKRYNPPGSVSYVKHDTQDITEAGDIAPALMHAYTDLTKLTATIYPQEAPLVVSGVRLYLPDTGTYPQSSLLRVERSDVTVADLQGSAPTGAFVTAAVQVQSASRVVFDRPRLYGFTMTGLGYGITMYDSANITLNDPHIDGCRHGVTGCYYKGLTINGGTVRIVDNHWGTGMKISDTTLLVEDGSVVVSVAGGGDTILENVTAVGGRVLVGIREDTPEYDGTITVRGGTWRPSLTDSAVWVAGYGSATNSAAGVTFWGRTLASPSRLTIDALTVDRTGVTAASPLVHFLFVMTHSFYRGQWKDVRVTKPKVIASGTIAFYYDIDTSLHPGGTGAEWQLEDMDFRSTYTAYNVYVANTNEGAAALSLRFINCISLYLRLAEAGIAGVEVRGGTCAGLLKTVAATTPVPAQVTARGVEFKDAAFNGRFLLNLSSTTWTASASSADLTLDGRIISVTGGILKRTGATGSPTAVDGYKSATYYL